MNNAGDNLIKELENKQSDTGAKFTLGKIPNKGEFCEVNGLRFEVMFVNKRTGELRLKLLPSQKMFAYTGTEAEYPTKPSGSPLAKEGV